jgi:hypothetical protein
MGKVYIKYQSENQNEREHFKDLITGSRIIKHALK